MQASDQKDERNTGVYKGQKDVRRYVDTELPGTITDTREHIHKELHANAQTTKALNGATEHEFQTQSKEIEAWAEHGTGTSANTVKPPNFNRTSWAVFYC
jgi:hypothetical protein